MLVVLVFIIILGLLIFVHELGHFVVARRNGIKAWEFGFGFPPRIFGIQFISGKKREKVMEAESVEVEMTDVKIGRSLELRRETITEKLHKVTKNILVGKWRFIWGSKDGDDTGEKTDLSEAHKNRFKGGTIYSLNWIPLGGFVKIKGEDGSNKEDQDSFSAKSAWTRTKVLAAGVAMNFLLAWIIISAGLIIGDPEPIDAASLDAKNSIIQIVEIAPNSPASAMKLEVGDVILKEQILSDGQLVSFNSASGLVDFINLEKGQLITLKIRRGNEILETQGTPRVEVPAGQGALGIVFQDSVLVKYPWYQALWKGAVYTYDLTVLMVVTLGQILKNLIFGHISSIEVSGPVGIAILTKQATQLGLIYILHLAAILSINLGIINILPFPALDGGRILFIAIEKIKGRPVSQKVERAFHAAGFALLITLMILVTFKDVAKFIK